jgi:uncharacterized membrane protein
LSPLANFSVLAIIGATLDFLGALGSRAEGALAVFADPGAVILAFFTKPIFLASRLLPTIGIKVPFFSCARLTPLGTLAAESM